MPHAHERDLVDPKTLAPKSYNRKPSPNKKTNTTAISHSSLFIFEQPSRSQFRGCYLLKECQRKPRWASETRAYKVRGVSGIDILTPATN